MDKKPKEIEIEAIETPKGNIPTVQGLETVVNALVGQITPLGEAVQGIHKSIHSINNALDYLAGSIQQIGDNLGEFLVLLAKINSNITDNLDELANNRIEGFEEQQKTLIELQTILAKLLVQFQALPVLQNQTIEEK
ncbi:MAG: hypothetical protein ACXAC7_00100 [Candidatus Hodarchaeales archaeon]|jgi:hypothetical protein